MSLALLEQYRQFIVCKFIPRADGKTDKVPYSADLHHRIDPHNPAHWVSACEAQSAAAFAGPEYGVGFVLTDHDPFVCVDIDGALQADGTWSPLAQELCNTVPGVVEVSHSGRGLHIWTRSAPIPDRGIQNDRIGLGVYATKRFIALGSQAVGSIPDDATAAVTGIVRKYLPRSTPQHDKSYWTTEPHPQSLPLLDDDALIAAAIRSRLSARAAYGGKADFRALWTGDEVALAAAYPTKTPGKPYDASEADAALMSHLAFWTGSDCERMLRIAKRSALYRDKWEARESYICETISKYASAQTAWHSRVPAPVVPGATPGRGFRLVKAGDLTLRAPQWVVRKTLERDSLVHVFGEPSAGKSFIAVDLSCCVATGTEWHGERVKQGAVIYLAGEGQNGISRRIKAWALNAKRSINDAPLYISTCPAALTDPVSVAEVLAAVAGVGEAPVLVVIDTLARNFGPGDENSTQDMTAFVAAADQIRSAYGACVMIVHHCGAGDKTRGRGNGALKGAVDAEYSVTRDAGAIILRAGKMKDAELPKPRAFSLRTVPLPGLQDDEGGVVTSAAPIPVDMPDEEDRVGGNEQAVLQCVVGAITPATLRNSCVPSMLTPAQYDKAVSALVDAGLIRLEGEGYVRS